MVYAYGCCGYTFSVYKFDYTSRIQVIYYLYYKISFPLFPFLPYYNS